jgi:hypothetical protein
MHLQEYGNALHTVGNIRGPSMPFCICLVHDAAVDIVSCCEVNYRIKENKSHILLACRLYKKYIYIE